MRTATWLAGDFTGETEFLTALRALRAAGCARFETSTPYPVEGAAEIIARPTRIGWVVLAGALAGAGGGFGLQQWAARAYPLDVGGRPLNSWPAFIPVTFELTVLVAALAGVAALFWMCGLPRLDSPLQQVPGIERASQDRFFVAVPAGEARLEASRLHAILQSARAAAVHEVHP